MDKVQLIVVIVLGIVSFILQIVGFVTAGWMIKHYPYNTEYYGLWYRVNCHTALAEERCERKSHTEVETINIQQGAYILVVPHDGTQVGGRLVYSTSRQVDDSLPLFVFLLSLIHFYKVF